ncbi:MAG: beta strand repeat-containing protein, partial [Rhizomicrobium sp.]
MGNNTAKRVSNFLGTSALTRPLFALGAASVLFGAGPAQAIDANTLPQNPNVVGGKDGFSQSGNTLNINQQTKRTVIDWRSFDIGSKAQVNFNQPGTSSIAVNRVNSSANPTQIQGGLHANGQVWILNPNGVFFGKTARVDAAGIVATTANIDDKAFMAGSNKLQMTGADHGSVENQGNISVGANGLAAFVAPSVRNSGTINATVGRVSLAAGTTYTLDLAGDHLVELGLGSVKAVVDNSGKIVNPGGTIALTAKAAGQVVSSVVNVSGTVSASSASASGGTITLGGDNVTTTSTAQVSADAGTNGNGGSITSVANNQGNYAGSFSAKGGSQSGNGGKVETSGHGNVDVDPSLKVDTSAAGGITGTWLIDPDTLTIDSGNVGTYESQLNTSNVNLTANVSITLNAAFDTSGQTNSNTLYFQDGDADGHLTVDLNAPITLGVNQHLIGDADVVNLVAGALIQNGIDVSRSSGGATVNVGAGTYSAGSGIVIGKSGIKLLGSNAEIDVDPGASGQVNAITINSTDGVTVSGFKIRGEVNSNYKTYAWGPAVSRGIAVMNGATNVTITNNDIANVRNGILIDGRNTGNVSNNVIDNTKSAISVQYTDAGLGNTEGYAITMAGNSQGSNGNEWGVNFHLNGHYVGPTYYNNSQKIATNATVAVQQALLDFKASNHGMTAQDQGYAQSNRTDVTVGPSGSDANQGSPLGNLATIQAGINAVVSGGIVNVLNGNYVIPAGSNYINVTKSLSLIGQSEAGVIIDARGGTTYGLRVSGPNTDVTLENFTLYGTTTYGLKAEDTTNLTLTNITSRGAGKSEFDLNGIINGTLTNLTADGAPVADATDSSTTSGNGISFTNSQHITLTNSTTRNNAWGGLALYQGTTYGDLQLTDITVNGSNTFHEANGIYAEDQSSVTDIGTIDLSGQGITYVAQGLVAPNDFYTWFRTSKQGAIDAAAAVSSVGYVQAYDGNVGGTGNFYVGTSTGGTAMSIQAAINAAASGAEIDVAAGTYTQALDIGKNVDIEGAGAGSTIIKPTALLTTGVGHKYDSNMKTAVYVHDASDVTINGVTIDANNLGANAVVFWNNAAGTISNAVIENPMAFSGVQTGQ